MDVRKEIVAGLLVLAGGASHAPVHAAEPADCARAAQERVVWRLHGNPAKPVAIAERVREARAACPGVADRDSRPNVGAERGRG